MPKSFTAYPNYLVFSNGDIIGPRGKFLKKSLTNNGYHRVTFSRFGKIKRMSVHRIVCSLYKKNPKNKPYTNHKNGIKTDNRSVNLEWATSLENVAHCLKNGLQNVTGMANPAAKLSERQVLAIRKSYANGNISQYKLAARYNLTKTNIYHIIKNNTWKHLLPINR